MVAGGAGVDDAEIVPPLEAVYWRGVLCLKINRSAAGVDEPRPYDWLPYLTVTGTTTSPAPKPVR